MRDSENRAIHRAMLAMLLVSLFFALICVYSLWQGSVSLGHPFKVTYQIAESPVLFWLAWSFWAALSLLSAGGALWLRGQGRKG